MKATAAPLLFDLTRNRAEWGQAGRGGAVADGPGDGGDRRPVGWAIGGRLRRELEIGVGRWQLMRRANPGVNRLEVLTG